MVVFNQLHSLVPRRASHCCKGKEPLLPDSEYYSYLLVSERGWERQDYCPLCWEKVREEKSELEGVEWKGKIPPQKTKHVRPPDKATHLLSELYHDQSAENQKLVFVLALYLERQKHLQMRASIKNKVCFENQETGQTYAIDRVELSSQELDQVVSKLLLKLE